MSKRVKVAKISIGVIGKEDTRNRHGEDRECAYQIGRASCRERV